MVAKMQSMVRKNLISPDEIRNFPNGRLELVHLADHTLARITLRPGWRWSRDVKPVIGTDSCEAEHLQYVISGHLRVRMDNGSEMELKPGDAAYIPSGHDAWVVGEEPFVAVDFEGLKQYAQKILDVENQAEEILNQEDIPT